MAMRVLVGSAALASIAVLSAASALIPGHIPGAERWGLATALTFPYWILFCRAPFEPRSFDRSFAIGTAWTAFALWMLTGVMQSVAWRTPFGFFYVVILPFVWPAVAFSVPFMVAQFVLARALQPIPGRRWIGFATPPIYAAAALSAMIIAGQMSRARTQRMHDEQARRQREAAESRARYRERLPLGREAWHVDLPLISSFFGVGLGADGDVNVASDTGVVAIRPYQGIRWINPMRAASLEPAVGEDGTVYAVSAPWEGSTLELDANGVLTAIDDRGRSRWAVVVCPSGVPYPPRIMNDRAIDVLCAPKAGFALQAPLVASVTPSGKLKWSVEGFRPAMLGRATGAETLYMIGAPILDKQSLRKGPPELLAVDSAGNRRWSLPMAADLVATMGDLVVAAGEDNFLQAVDAEGRPKWRVQLPFRRAWRMVASTDETVVAGEDMVVAVNSAGSIKWQFRVSDAIGSSQTPSSLAIGARGTVYVLVFGNVLALDESGAVAWIYRLDQKMNEQFASLSVPLMDGLAIVVRNGTDSGRRNARLAVVQATH
jgi:outer membrane protein assembly factor BamB